MKLFNECNNHDIYNNILLSKYSIMLKPNFLFSNLKINLELKYSFKNLDETLLIFWLFYILNDGMVIPIVKFSKFNKKLCFMVFKNISINFLEELLHNFLYNIKYTALKNKKVAYISNNKFLYSYKKSNLFTPFCFFNAQFKQNYLEHIFYDLGVSGLKLVFKLSCVGLNSRNSALFKDILQISDFEYFIKSYMFEEYNPY